MNKAQFSSELKKLVAWEEEPQLDDDDLELIFTKSRRRDVDGYQAERVRLWERNRAFTVDQVVIPTTADGNSYICVTAGTSSSTEPTWDTTNTDGTVSWERYEVSYWTPSYDLNHAASIAWGMKASRAVSRISFTSEGSTFQRQQYIANCLSMQRLYASRLSFSSKC